MSSSPTPHHPGQPVTNISYGGQAVQGVDVKGNIAIQAAAPATSPTDIAAELEALRHQLDRAATEGRIDADTVEAAHDELAQARSALRQKTPHSEKRVVMALKRLRGLVADTADIAAKVAVVLTALGVQS